MYGAGNELYEYYQQLNESETEHTFGPEDAESFEGYLAFSQGYSEAKPKRKKKALGKEKQTRSKSRSKKSSGKRVRH